MLKARTSLRLGLLALIMASQAYPALAQTTASVPATAGTTPVKREPIKELGKIDTVVGTGAEAATGNIVTIHDTGWLYTYNPNKPDHKGTEFVNSSKIGEPATFQLGSGKKITGLEQGIVGMKIGGKRTLIIPSELGYGSRSIGRGMIPPNSALVFDIELLDVK